MALSVPVLLFEEWGWEPLARRADARSREPGLAPCPDAETPHPSRLAAPVGRLSVLFLPGHIEEFNLPG